MISHQFRHHIFEKGSRDFHMIYWTEMWQTWPRKCWNSQLLQSCLQWRIQDFPQGGAPTPKIAIIFHIFAENCMKMKEFGPQGGRASLAPPLGSANGLFWSCIFWLQVGLYTGALFIQQSLGWDLYLCIFILLIIVGILTITGKHVTRTWPTHLKKI